MSNMNPELQAQTLMNQVISGDMKGFHNFINSQIDSTMLNYVINQLKTRGNEAFQKGRYAEAIEYYDQALAGIKEKNIELQSTLLNNKVAALSGSKKYKESLELSGQVIQLRPSWSKAWYRAGRTLYEMQSYGSALKVFKVALKKEPSNKYIQNWISKTEPLAKKEKALERITIDYTRFQDIKDDSDIHNENETTEQNLLEFADDVSIEERSRLEKILTGQSSTSSTTSTVKPPPRPIFNPEFIYAPITSKNEFPDNFDCLKMKDQIKIGLLNLLQIQSELNVPRRIAENQLATTHGKLLLHQYLRAIQSLHASTSFSNVHSSSSEKEENTIGIKNDAVLNFNFTETTTGSCDTNLDGRPYCNNNGRKQFSEVCNFDSFFFLGSGTCIAVIRAVQLFPNSKFHICTNHPYPFLAWMAERMFSINDIPISSNIKIHSKPVHQMTVQSDKDEKQPISELESELLDISSERSKVMVIDPDLFDSTGIARRALFDICNARQRTMVKCRKQGLVVIPCGMKLSVRAVSLRARCSKESAPLTKTSSIDRAKWSVNWETYRLGDLQHKKDTAYSQRPGDGLCCEANHKYSENSVEGNDFKSECEYLDRYQSLSSPVSIFEFTFDGPVESLAEDIPLNECKTVTLTFSETGRFDAFILTTQFDFPNAIPNAIDASSQSIVSLFDNQNNQPDPTTSMLFSLSSSFSSTCGVLWMDPMDVIAGQSVKVECSHDGSRVRLRIIEPIKNPTAIRSVAIPRWQWDTVDDTKILNEWNRVLRDALAEKFKERIARIDRRRNLNTSQLRNIEVLIFNSSLGHLSVESLRTAAMMYASRAAKPSPTFHVTTIESSMSQTAIARALAKENCELITEDFMISTKKTGLQWNSFSGESRSNSDKESARKGSQSLVNCTGQGDEVRCLPEHQGSSCYKFSKQIDVATVEKKARSFETNNDISNKEDTMRSDPAASDVLSKIRARLSTLTKDPRQLRPPHEDGMSKLALARLLNAPVGPSGPNLPPSETDDHLNDKVDLIVTQQMDCGLLGEGLLPVLLYSSEALIKSNATVIPYKARICAVGVHLGGQIHSHVRNHCWFPLFGGMESALSVNANIIAEQLDYTAISFDEHQLITTMTSPIQLFEFDLGDSLKTSTLKRTEQINFQATQDGSINAVIFWFDLLLESHDDARKRGRNTPIAITTCPIILEPKITKDVKGGYEIGNDQNEHSNIWLLPLQRISTSKQAVQLLPELIFKASEIVPLVASHAESNISFQWSPELPDIQLRQCLSSQLLTDCQMIQSWKLLLNRHRAILNQMSEMYADHKIHKLAAEASMSIAINPGRYNNHRIDPEQAMWLCLSFFY